MQDQMWRTTDKPSTAPSLLLPTGKET